MEKAACTLILGSAGCFYHFDFKELSCSEPHTSAR